MLSHWNLLYIWSYSIVENATGGSLFWNNYGIRNFLFRCIYSATRFAIEDPKLIEYMGQRSREIALNKYDVHQVNKHMMAEMDIH